MTEAGASKQNIASSHTLFVLQPQKVTPGDQGQDGGASFGSPPVGTVATRWRHSAALRAALHAGANARLTGDFPPSGRPLAPLALGLPDLFTYRLLLDRFTEGCAIASSVPNGSHISGRRSQPSKSLTRLWTGIRRNGLSRKGTQGRGQRSLSGNYRCGNSLPNRHLSLGRCQM